MNLDEQTSRVVEMYSKFPFPFQGNHGNYFEQVVLPTIREAQKEYPVRRLLDAGCGTGNLSADIATLLPEVELTAVDITDESLGIARDRIARLGLKNVTFRKSNLMQYDPELGQFDFVYSQGVIHHLSDPLTGMKNLFRYLKDGHHAFIWLYAIMGRREILEMREALKVLGADDLSWEEKVQLARQVRPLFYSGKPSMLRKVIKLLDYVDKYRFKGLKHYLSDYFKRTSHEKYDNIILADQILHPQDKFYRVREAIEMFENAGFEFIRVVQGMSNTPEESFGQAIPNNGKKLSRLDYYTLIELHEKPAGFGFLIKKPKA
jgi:ubiquinone/menaquinone biosynthesis C-methylase UbiE